MLGRRFEGGVGLSGGEWQKIALARAYLRDEQLLTLDEPTASLDGGLERFADTEVSQRASRFAKLAVRARAEQKKYRYCQHRYEHAGYRQDHIHALGNDCATIASRKIAPPSRGGISTK